MRETSVVSAAQWVERLGMAAALGRAVPSEQLQRLAGKVPGKAAHQPSLGSPESKAFPLPAARMPSFSMSVS